MLRRLADRDFNRGWGCRQTFPLALPLNNSLYRISEQLADDIFQVAQYVRESGVKMAQELDFWEDGGGPVGGGCEGLYLFSAARYDFFGVAFQKYFADELGLQGFRVGEVPGGVESLG